ncbi:MAG: alpha/beta hydrolase [Ilumatobacteraceae bacterium]|nr:alpha/beta hydrolase [Ilumatobacteraceae bacterium]
MAALERLGWHHRGATSMIQKLAAHFEVLIHDQRGLGRTTVPHDTPTMCDYAADAAALLDRLGLPSTLVVGISFGGMVAQEFAVTWPARVERLALLCTSPGGAGGSSYPLHTLTAMSAAEQARLRLHLADSRYTPEFLAANPFDQRLVELGVVGRAAPRTEGQLRGEAMQLVARSGHDVSDRLGQHQLPHAGCVR